MVGLLGYAAVSPMLLLIPVGLGFVCGFALGPVFGWDPEVAGSNWATGLTATLGPLLYYALAREAWARVFSQVRLGPGQLEFERFGKTISWPLEQLRCVRVSSQSTSVNLVQVTEASIALTGPDGRRLHLTDLKSNSAGTLLQRASDLMAERWKRELANGPLTFGSKLTSHLNIYSMGPPIFLTGILAAFNLGVVGLVLSALYFANLYRQIRATTVVLTLEGIRRANETGAIPWSEVTGAEATLDAVEISTGQAVIMVSGPENMVPLAALVNSLAQG